MFFGGRSWEPLAIKLSNNPVNKVVILPPEIKYAPVTGCKKKVVHI